MSEEQRGIGICRPELRDSPVLSPFLETVPQPAVSSKLFLFSHKAEMISEVLNALFLTYIATEYSSVTLCALPCLVVVAVNLVERLSFLGAAVSNVLHQFLHIPKVLFAAISFVVLLYDCRRVHPTLRVLPYLQQVGLAFLYVLPVYPFLAVLISFGFLFIINIFEFLHLNEEILNWPIYYGVLYGPFSFVYWRVKEKVMQEKSSLPSVSGNGRILGSSRQ